MEAIFSCHLILQVAVAAPVARAFAAVGGDLIRVGDYDWHFNRVVSKGSADIEFDAGSCWLQAAAWSALTVSSRHWISGWKKPWNILWITIPVFLSRESITTEPRWSTSLLWYFQQKPSFATHFSRPWLPLQAPIRGYTAIMVYTTSGHCSNTLSSFSSGINSAWNSMNYHNEVSKAVHLRPRYCRYI